MIQSQPSPNWRRFFNKQTGSGKQTGACFKNCINTRFHAGVSPVFTFLVFVSAFTLPSLASGNTDNSYLQSLLQEATDRQLAHNRYWHLLLHYRPNLFSGWTSEVDDLNFFLAPDGKTNPQTELEATIKSFFSDSPRVQSQQVSQCAFIARYHWLKTELEIDTRQLPEMTCDNFENWLAELHPQGISLIFPSSYMNNPASMFGHTFLRIDQKGQTEQTRLLAYTINYAAEVPPNAGIEFAYNGISGGYKGYFTFPPYYLKVKEYRDIENRDIWEYRLNLTKEQVEKLLEHVWELGEVYFDYFFFKENCAYHILSLLEIANPGLHLTDQFIFWTVPADTIRLISQQRDFVIDVTYRPSQYTKIKWKTEQLPPAQFKLFQSLLEDPLATVKNFFRNLSVNEKVFLLDLGLDYLQYQSTNEKDAKLALEDTNAKLLLSRSTLGVKSPIFNIPPYSRPPEEGHKTSRTSVGSGWRQAKFFEEFTIRAGYHDLLDPDPGYTPGSQIQLLSVGLRHYEKWSQFRLEKFTLANVVSLAPMDGLFKTPSWKFNIGMETIRFKRCKLCSNGNLNAGIGASTETHLHQREVYFVFAEVDGNVSSAFDHHYRAGGGVTGGILINFTERWKVLGSVGYLGYPLGDRSDDFRYAVSQRWTLSQNCSLRTEFYHRDRDNQVLGTIQFFF